MTGATEDKILLEINKSTKNEGPKYPRSIFILVIYIICERFSMGAMHALLALYFIDWLHFDRDLATALYHGFVIVVFTTPLVGATLADGYWGKYKTIAILSVVHSVGVAILTFTAFPPPNWIGPSLGLILIALGVGGMRPCCSALGGDQFSSEQGSDLKTFFSVNYFALHFGHMCALISTPILKSYVQCFGTNCYPLAFGVSLILVTLGTALFLGGSSLFKTSHPTGNVIGRFLSCLGRAIKNRWNCSSKDCKKHWLDHADDQYEMTYIGEMKDVFRLLILLLPLPIVSALAFQPSSRWTLQARAMDRSVGTRQVGLWTVPAGLIQVSNSVLVLIFVPMFDLVIYPVCARCNFLTRPLQRMVGGMVFVGLAFVAAGILQIEMDKHLDHFPDELASVKVINTLPCQVYLESNFGTSIIPPSQVSKMFEVEPGNAEVRLKLKAATCPQISQGASAVYDVTLLRHKAHGLAVSWRHNSLALDLFQYPMVKPEHGGAFVGFLLTSEAQWQHGETLNVFVCKQVDSQDTDVITPLNQSQCMSRSYIYGITPFNQSQFMELMPDKYHISLPPGSAPGVSLAHGVIVEGGGVYTINIKPNYPVSHQMESATFMLVAPNEVFVLWQLPQYVLLGISEVLFFISGSTFTYSQSPRSMKSMMLALWFVLGGAGNAIAAIITGGRWLPNQVAEFFFFASLAGLMAVIFAVMSYFYTYVDYNSDTEDDKQELVVAEELPSRRDPGELDKEGPSYTMYGTTNSN